MNEKLRKLLKYSGIVFIIAFAFLLLEKSTGANLGLRHKKVLETIVKISLGVFSLLLIYKSLLGYRHIISRKDYRIFLDIIKTILILALIIIIFNYILNLNRIIKKNIASQIIKLVLFILLSFGLIYDEAYKK